MDKKFDMYTAPKEMILLEALKCIDKNNHGFLVVIDDDEFAGVLTDGDIRRALVAGKSITDSIESIFNRNSQTVFVSQGMEDVTTLFRNKSVNFLPVLDENNKLVNIITKRQIYSMLLQDISADLTYDFMSLDESIVDYEIYHRPWGFYRTTVMNEYFQSKVISVNPKSKLSLQSHNHREEYWTVAHGHGLVQIGESIKEADCGSTFFIPKGCRHRLMNTDENETLIVTEVQIGDYFGEDDIIRYEDIYDRA